MPVRYLITVMAVLMSLSWPCADVTADVITLNVPIVEDSPNLHLYFHELLVTAIREAGHEPVLTTRRMPQLRTKEELAQGNISIYWMVESAERNERFIPIEVGLTDGLIGKRILFIRKGDQHLFDQVKTLDDFRDLGLVGGLGKRWYDVKVWKANNLRFREEGGNWQSIFRKIPLGRDYDYFSRGINEILEEAERYPELAIERRLVLIYDRDFRFYLSDRGKNPGKLHREVLEKALVRARESGLIEKLVQKYWSGNLKRLNYENRVKIHLETPE